MSHITKQSERDENSAIWNCPYREVPVYVKIEDCYYTGEEQWEWQTQNQCGPSEYIGTAKDRCVRCNKVFTY